MKKIMMTLAAVAVAASVNAQAYIGGTVGFGFGKDKTEVSAGGSTVSTDNKTTAFTIAPEIGYKLDENSAVGIALGFTHSKNEPAANTTVKNNAFSIKPYFRYTFVKWGDLSLFADAQLGFTTGKQTNEVSTGGTTTSTDVKTTAFSIAVVPGISYQVNEKINFVAKLGDGLGYWNTKREQGNTTVKSNEFGLNASTLGLSFGMYYNF